jgi:secondary thiamine-phosphate synthase enzyme
MVTNKTFQISTRGDCEVIDITPDAAEMVAESGISNGTITLFNIGSTAGITTTEYEPGLVNHDIKAAFEKIAPKGARYEHEETWHDDNGHSHVRASLLGP